VVVPRVSAGSAGAWSASLERPANLEEPASLTRLSQSTKLQGHQRPPENRQTSAVDRDAHHCCRRR
jgi:hypothetical protein